MATMVDARATVEPRPVAGRALARRLAWASILAGACAAICYLVMVRTSLGQSFDNAAFDGAREQVPGVAAASSGQLARITTDSFALVLLVLVTIGVLRRRVLLGLGAALAAGVAVVGTQELKDRFLSRPTLTPGHFAGNTFPSGHAATAVACAMALVLVSPPRWRGLAAVAAGAYGWITAAQVQTAGWHRPSDAVGAALLAFASVAAVGAILAWARPVGSLPPGRHRVAQGVLAVVAMASLAMASLAVVGWELIGITRYLHANARGLRVPAHVRHDAYLTGLAGTVAIVVILLMTLLALLGRADLGGPDRTGTARRTPPPS